MQRRVFWALVIATGAIHAAGVAMPWDVGLTGLANNMTGQTAIGLCTVGAGIQCIPLMFHGDFQQFGHKGAYMFVAGAALLGVKTIVALLGAGGALI